MKKATEPPVKDVISLRISVCSHFGPPNLIISRLVAEQRSGHWSTFCTSFEIGPPFSGLEGVERHRGRVIHLEYRGGEKVDTSLFVVGKGITFDTGGSDVKAGGVMAGMHRDKCGAAAVAGFLRTLALLRPAGLRVVAHLAFVRNALGPNAYVADEIITSRAGKRVRIGNTDAEGRMVMSDLLCLAKEEVRSPPSLSPSTFLPSPKLIT